MKILNRVVKTRKSRNTPPDSRRHSTAFDLKFPPVFVDQKALVETKIIDMQPRNSATSLPLSPAATSHPRSPPPVAQNFFQRPTLSSILANESPAPWTLEAFTEYCEQNHCAENLNFVMDAHKYSNEYHDWLSRCTVPPSEADLAESEYLANRWQSILSQYIIPLSPQEVNISGDVREGITMLSEPNVAAEPSALEPAVRKVMELMQDSVVFSFLHDVRPENAAPRQIDEMQGVEHSHRSQQHFHFSHSIHQHGSSMQDWQKSRSIQIEAPLSGSPPASSSGFGHTQSMGSLYHKQSIGSTTSSSRHPASISSYRSSRPKSVVSNKELESSASPSMQSVDDISDAPSPYAWSDSKSTSPSLPPLRSVGSQERHMSPRARSEGGWKKFGAMMGLKKSRGETPP